MPIFILTAGRFRSTWRGQPAKVNRGTVTVNNRRSFSDVFKAGASRELFSKCKVNIIR